MSKDPAFLFYSSDFLTGVMDLTMEENGIYDNATIFVVKENEIHKYNFLNVCDNQNNGGFQIKGTKTMHLTFENQNTRKTYSFVAGNKNTAKEVFSQFIEQYAIGDGSTKYLKFIYDNKEITKKDERTLEDIFNGRDYPKILLLDIQNVIGA